MTEREQPELSELGVYVEAKERGELLNYYLNKFKKLREEYIDTLPADAIKMSDPDYYRYKARGNYIFMLAGVLMGAIEDNIVTDPNAVATVESFKMHHWKYYEGEFTSQEEITLINSTLDMIVRSLETKAGDTTQ